MKNFKSIFNRSLSVLLSVSVMTVGLIGAGMTSHAETADTEATSYTLQSADNVDLTSSLISGIMPNSITLYDENLSKIDPTNTTNTFTWTGSYFGDFTDNNSDNPRTINHDQSYENDVGETYFIGSFKYYTNPHTDYSFRNKGDNLELYYDIVFPLDEKTGLPVEVSQFYLSGATDSLSLYKYKVYFSNELNTLASEENCLIDYTNDDASKYDLITLDSPVTATYMMIRVTMGVQPTLAYWEENAHLRISEVAVFGDANPDLSYTVNSSDTAFDASESLIKDVGVAVTEHNHKTGTYHIYDTRQYGHFKITDGEFAARDFNVLAFNDASNGGTLNMGNKLDSTMDLITSLTEKDGKQKVVRSVALANRSQSTASDKWINTYRYYVYLSNTLDSLGKTESLVATYTNVNFNQYQVITLDTPVTAAYMMIRITMSQGIEGRNGISGVITDANSCVRVRQIAVFGESTADYTISDGTNEDFTQSLIYGSGTESSYQSYLKNELVVNGVFATGNSVTDGNLSGEFPLGDGNRWNEKLLDNSGPYLETYEDFIFDLQKNNGGTVDIDSFVVSGYANYRCIYKFEVYASKSRDALGKADTLVATCSNLNYMANLKVDFEKSIAANYIMLRVIFANDPYSDNYGGDRSWTYTRINEFAVFGTKNKDYTLTNGEMPKQNLTESYISGRNPVAFYVFDDGTTYSLMKGDAPTLTNSSLISIDSNNWQSGENPNDSSIKNGSFLNNSKTRRNTSADMAVYMDVVYMLDPFGKSETVEKIYIGECSEDGNCTNAYSYEIFIADTIEELGKEASFVASIVNPEGKQNNYVTLAEAKTGKYIMIRNTMGVQLENFAFGGDLSYARTLEIAVLGAPRAIIGDVNTDNKVDVRDLIRFKKYSAGYTVEFSAAAGDVDESGSLDDATDIGALRKYLLMAYTFRPEVYTEGGELTQEIINASRTNIGNRYRLAEKLEAFKAGGEFTVAYIGGSITEGSGASSNEYCYASQITKWLRETYPQSTFNMVNAGISATGSILGVHRIPGDVLAYDPDLLFVEYSANESETDMAAMAAYESLIYRAWNYESKPAIISLAFFNAEQQGAQQGHYEIVKHYDIPMISMADVVRKLVAEKTLDETVDNGDGTTTTISTFSKLYSDACHPADLGCKIVGQLVASYLADVANWSEIILADGKAESNFDVEPLYSRRYVDGEMITIDNNSDNPLAGYEASYTSNGFEVNTDDSFSGGYWEGAEGSSITFTVTAKSLGMIYDVRPSTAEKPYGHIEIEIDGVPSSVKPNCNAGPAMGGEIIYCGSTGVIDFDEISTHTVTIKAVGGYAAFHALTVANGAE